jgi:hypothetical protein
MHRGNVSNLSVQSSSSLFMMQFYFKDIESLKHKICN